MSTFLTDMINKGHTEKEVLDVFFESKQEKERRRILAIVSKTVDALRLKNIREFLAYQQLATWRRMNGFDRGVEGEKSCFNGRRSLPPTPQEYYAGLWSEVNALKEAISMPAEDTVNRPRQKDSLDELLANVEFAIMKEYVEKRSGEAGQVTVTQVNTVQHSSPYPLNPEPSPSVYAKLENTEAGKMGPELDELKSPSAGTGLKTPGHQCPPNEGIWETGRTTASGILTAGAGPSQGENISSPTEREKSTTTVADISSKAATPPKRRHKTFSQENKQFDPGGKGEKAPPWKAAVTLPSFSGESWKAPCLLSVCASCFVSALCVSVSPIIFLFSGDDFSERYERRRESRIKSLMYATGEQAFSPYHAFEDGEDKQHPVWS